MAVFLMENGVLSMGNKTPVTILQETLQRQGLVPHYELLYNGVGTLDPIFKYQVTGVGISAIGHGKSKKEAKHDAAAALLKRMQSGSDSSEMEIASPYTGALKQNFVGMLEEICVCNKLPLPEFVPISEDGPPHARIFTMRCKVSSCSETAVARTKKQAKHMVAQQMLRRIEKIMGDKFLPLAEKSADCEESLVSVNLKAIESGNYRHNFATPVAGFHNVFHQSSEEFIVPNEFFDLCKKPVDFFEHIENPREYLDFLVRQIEGVVKHTCLSKESLKKTLQEIEKDCLHFSLAEDEQSENQYEEDSSSDLCSEHNGELLEELILEDIDSSCSSDTLNSTENQELIHAFNFKQELSITTPLKISEILLLTVECPQGKWVFQGVGSTITEAEKIAVSKALTFLSIMSVRISKSNEKSDLEL